MFFLLSILALGLFIAHVILLFTSFPQKGFQRSRYFYSHLTLWLTGIIVFGLTTLYSGDGQSVLLDYFDTPVKKIMILVVTLILSITAHLIVKTLVLPKKKAVPAT
ncbi:hypothetical protein [Taibaiella soli]|uniref:Uncharacterized protein n=1 Tax=Taibaiella soli TaxID=1649169 RepID=A0A2W2AG19_9BACT|nr:hypothetical protein [Taibaiella soli]PZF74251.1 hypothetical protein DN068_04350 [Taibaiella soli]